jgi:uncharacterized membrane protein
MRNQLPSWSRYRAQWKLLSENLHSQLKYIYLVYAVLGVLLTATITPGFQAPDERAHFLRAEQVSRGVLVANFILLQPNGEHRYSEDKRIIYPDSGGYIGARSINRTAYTYESIVANANGKVTDSLIRASKKYRWDGDMGIVNFPNTGFYPPTGYIFPAIGIITGKIFRINILDTLILSRILNGIGCSLICFFALGLAKRCRLFLFFLLLLPLTVFLFSSVSQDAMLVSLAALIVGIIDHVESGENRRYTRAQIVWLVISIIAISVARPPYFLFIFVFLFLRMSPRIKVLSVAATFLTMIIWGMLNAHNYAVAFAPPEMGVNAKLQLAWVMAHPFKFIGFFFHWNVQDIMAMIREYIGILGWLDLVLPGYYYKLAFFILLLSAISVISFSREKLTLRVVCIFAAFITFVSIMAAQYITWMPLESPHLGGVQARYFIPVIFFLALGIAGFHKEKPLKNWQLVILPLIVIFPIFSELITVNNLIIRYYLH